MKFPDSTRRWVDRRLTEHPEQCLVFQPGDYRPDGSILIYPDGVAVFLHRWLYERYIGPIPTKMFVLARKAICRQGCQNPHHRRLDASPGGGVPPQPRKPLSRATGAPTAPQINAAKDRCPANHEYTPENTYRWVDKQGHAHRKCKTCTLRRTRKRHSDERRARKEGTS